MPQILFFTWHILTDRILIGRSLFTNKDRMWVKPSWLNCFFLYLFCLFFDAKSEWKFEKSLLKWKKKWIFNFKKSSRVFQRGSSNYWELHSKFFFLLSSKSCSKNVNVFKMVTTKIPPISNKTKKEIKDFSDEKNIQYPVVNNIFLKKVWEFMDGLVVERFFDVKSQNVESKYNLKSIDYDMVNLSLQIW